MKISFLIKYMGKTMIIGFAMVALGRIAHLDNFSITLVIVACMMYGYGSVIYQSTRRKKSNKLNSKTI